MAVNDNLLVWHFSIQTHLGIMIFRSCVWIDATLGRIHTAIFCGIFTITPSPYLFQIQIAILLITTNI